MGCRYYLRCRCSDVDATLDRLPEFVVAPQPAVQIGLARVHCHQRAIPGSQRLDHPVEGIQSDLFADGGPHIDDTVIGFGLVLGQRADPNPRVLIATIRSTIPYDGVLEISAGSVVH